MTKASSCEAFLVAVRSIIMGMVFLLWHTGSPDVDDEGMLIGVFRSEEDAKNAINALADNSGSIGCPDGSLIWRYQSGKLPGQTDLRYHKANG